MYSFISASENGLQGTTGFKLYLLCNSHTHDIVHLLQGSRFCAREALRQLAERCARLGHFQEPILGHADPHVGQRRLWGGQENTRDAEMSDFLAWQVTIEKLSTVETSNLRTCYIISHFYSFIGQPWYECLSWMICIMMVTVDIVWPLFPMRSVNTYYTVSTSPSGHHYKVPP